MTVAQDQLGECFTGLQGPAADDDAIAQHAIRQWFIEHGGERRRINRQAERLEAVPCAVFGLRLEMREMHPGGQGAFDQETTKRRGGVIGEEPGHIRTRGSLGHREQTGGGGQADGWGLGPAFHQTPAYQRYFPLPGPQRTGRFHFTAKYKGGSGAHSRVVRSPEASRGPCAWSNGSGLAGM